MIGIKVVSLDSPSDSEMPKFSHPDLKKSQKLSSSTVKGLLEMISDSEGSVIVEGEQNKCGELRGKA